MQPGQTTSGSAPEAAAPERDLARLIDGYLTTQLLYVAAKLGVADILADGPRTGREVAEAVGADPEHDWDDADAPRILATCRAAMPAGARLLVVEAIVPERAHDGPEAVRMDIHMLILFGARERTEAQFRDLLAGAGFELRRVVPTASAASLSVLEATVASGAR